MAVVYIGVLIAALIFSFSRRRILVLCLFFCIYGTLKVMAQDQDSALSWSQLLLFRALYPILCVSLIIRFFRDPAFLKQLKTWPLFAYLLVLCITLLNALYSNSHQTFAASPFNVWGQIVIALLFIFSAAHIQTPEDLTTFAAATVLTSLALSTWILWTTASLNFSAFRGGVDVNQNFVSLFVLAGAIPLIHMLFRLRKFWPKIGILCLLGIVMIGAVLLASRGMLIAFAVAVIAMSPKLISGKPIKSTVIVFIVLFSMLLLPGAANLVERFHEADVGSFNGRSLVWGYSLHNFAGSGLAHMFFGLGYNSAQILLPPAMEPGSWNYHNEYLNNLMDGGIIGLAAFAALLFSIWRRVRATTHPLQNVMRGWMVFLLVASLSGVLSGMHIFWLLLGSICGGTAAEMCPSPDRTRRRLFTQIYRRWKNAIHQSIDDDVRMKGLLGPTTSA